MLLNGSISAESISIFGLPIPKTILLFGGIALGVIIILLVVTGIVVTKYKKNHRNEELKSFNPTIDRVSTPLDDGVYSAPSKPSATAVLPRVKEEEQKEEVVAVEEFSEDFSLTDIVDEVEEDTSEVFLDEVNKGSTDLGQANMESLTDEQIEKMYRERAMRARAHSVAEESVVEDILTEEPVVAEDPIVEVEEAPEFAAEEEVEEVSELIEEVDDVEEVTEEVEEISSDVIEGEEELVYEEVNDDVLLDSEPLIIDLTEDDADIILDNDTIELETAFGEETIAQREERLAEEARVAEEQRLEEERIAEEERLAEEQKLAEEQRLEEERLAEEARVAEEQRLAEEERLKEEQRLAEEQRLEEERLAEEQRLAELERALEEARLTEAEKYEAQLKEAEEARLREAERLAEEKKLEEEARIRAEEELARLAEERDQQAEALRLAEEERLREEERALAEERLREEERNALEEAHREELERAMEEARLAEAAKYEAQLKEAEEARLRESERLAEAMASEEARKEEADKLAREAAAALAQSRFMESEVARLAREKQEAEETALKALEERKRAMEYEDEFEEDPDDDAIEIAQSKYKRSFKSKLIQGTDNNKMYYSEVKNELLSYNKCRSSLSWQGESFIVGKKTLAKIALGGKTVCLFLALNPDEFDPQVFHHRDKRESKKYSQVPMMLRIKSDLALRKAISLIVAMMDDNNIERNVSREKEDYRRELAFRTDEELLAKGLIKLNVSAMEVVPTAENKEDSGEVKTYRYVKPIKKSELNKPKVEKKENKQEEEKPKLKLGVYSLVMDGDGYIFQLKDNHGKKVFESKPYKTIISAKRAVTTFKKALSDESNLSVNMTDEKYVFAIRGGFNYISEYYDNKDECISLLNQIKEIGLNSDIE